MKYLLKENYLGPSDLKVCNSVVLEKGDNPGASFNILVVPNANEATKSDALSRQPKGLWLIFNLTALKIIKVE